MTVPRDDASRLDDFNDFNDGSGDGDNKDKGRGGDGTKRSRKKSARRPEIHVRLRCHRLYRENENQRERCLRPSM